MEPRNQHVYLTLYVSFVIYPRLAYKPVFGNQRHKWQKCFCLVYVFGWLTKNTIFISHGWATLHFMVFQVLKNCGHMENGNEVLISKGIGHLDEHALWGSIFRMFLNYHASILSLGFGFKRKWGRRKQFMWLRNFRLFWNFWLYDQCLSLLDILNVIVKITIYCPSILYWALH